MLCSHNLIKSYLSEDQIFKKTNDFWDILYMIIGQKCVLTPN